MYNYKYLVWSIRGLCNYLSPHIIGYALLLLYTVYLVIILCLMDILFMHAQNNTMELSRILLITVDLPSYSTKGISYTIFT